MLSKKLLEELILNINNRTGIRNDILEMIDLLTENISALMDVLSELKDFKHSKKIEEYKKK